MKTEELALSAIKPYGKNPRKNDGAVDGVAESIKRFRFQQPIVIDSKGVIVVGHTRYKAAQKLGLKTVPCVRADQLTKEQVKAYRILDNKLNEKSYWDFDLLEAEDCSRSGAKTVPGPDDRRAYSSESTPSTALLALNLFIWSLSNFAIAVFFSSLTILS